MNDKMSLLTIIYNIPKYEKKQALDTSMVKPQLKSLIYTMIFMSESLKLKKRTCEEFNIRLETEDEIRN